MKHPKNGFLHAIKTGQKQLGLWISMGESASARVLADSGFDWFLIDMEHSQNDYSSVLTQRQILDSETRTAIVRPEWIDPVVVKRLMDAGARGLLFPMINTAEEAEKAVASTRYPPKGIRGFAGVTPANKFGRVTDYLDQVEQETAVIVQLESKQAIDNAWAIAAVDGVDGVFFGPADIAADIGFLGRPMDPAVWDLIRPCAKSLIAKGVPAGTLVLDPEFAADLLNDGFSFVACGTDAALLARESDALLEIVSSKMTGEFT